MKKPLLALPVLALFAIAGIAAAQPYFDPQELTQEQKEIHIRSLEQRQDMIQDRISYINGELTQEQFQQRLEQHQQEMDQLREQFREQLGIEGCPCGHGPGGTGNMMGSGKGMGMQRMHWGW